MNRDDIDYRDFKMFGTLGRKKIFLVVQLRPEWKELEYNLSSSGKNAVTIFEFIHNLWNSSLSPYFRNKKLSIGNCMISFWIKILTLHALNTLESSLLIQQTSCKHWIQWIPLFFLPHIQQQENTMLPVYQWCGLSPSCLEHLQGM